MLVRNLVQKLRPVRHLRAFSSSEAQITNETAPVSIDLSSSTSSLSKNWNIDEYRKHQLERLQSLKPSDFTPSALNQLISDFLICPLKPDVQVAAKLLDKFLFKIPGIDGNGDLCSLYLLQLIDVEDIGAAADFFMKLLKSKEESAPVNLFMFECVWKAVIDTKSDSIGLELLKACKETTQPAISEQVNSSEFQENLIIQLFLPRLNWPAMDFLVSASVSNNQITIPAEVLQEIFHVLLNPIPNDYHHDIVEFDPFTADVVNPRFHRLIEALSRWKNSGIPIKGSQIAKALEESFKKFLPTESMMESLQKLL